MTSPTEGAVQPEVGDLWVVGSLDESDQLQRIVLVVGIDKDQADVVLTSPDIDFVADRDIVLPPSLSGAAYGLMVETALYGRVWERQARKRIGVVGDDLVDSILDFIWEERPENLEHLRGFAWPEPLIQPRGNFEVAELSEFRRLTMNRSQYHPTEVEA